MQFIEANSGTLMGGPDWREPIDSVGTDQFSSQLMRSLEQWAGAEHFAAFNLTENDFRLLAADITLSDGTALAISPSDLYHGEPILQCARQACREGELSVLRMDLARPWNERQHPDILLNREVCDGVVFSGAREGRIYGLSLIRTAARGRFTDAELNCIRAVAGTWLSLVATHERILRVERRKDPAPVLLRSVDEIEDTLRTILPSLTKREAQVCARILRGMSTPGMAIDLAVCEESVATYRKRAYRRLEIGSRFELIRLFITAAVSATAAQHRVCSNPLPAPQTIAVLPAMSMS
jgi:LuxR family transcriptional regulator, activator of tox operons